MSFLAKLDETVVSLNTGPRRIVARNYLLDSEAVQGTASWVLRPTGRRLRTCRRSRPRYNGTCSQFQLATQALFVRHLDLMVASRPARQSRGPSSRNLHSIGRVSPPLSPPLWRQYCIPGKEKKVRDIGGNCPAHTDVIGRLRHCHLGVYQALCIAAHFMHHACLCWHSSTKGLDGAQPNDLGSTDHSLMTLV